MPWTHARLATASGYGAGITSPGWYHHLFTAPDQVIERWMIKVARLLRSHDLPVSSAHVIDAVRLAEALAALRGRPLAGLAEVTDAAKAVMCDGDDFAAAFVTRDLVVGERLGAVPDTAPAVPLERDLRARARSLKLKISPDSQTIALDLRTTNGRARSVLLHRLSVLGIAWGERTGDLVSSTGTFRETWVLSWQPELSVAIIDGRAVGDHRGGRGRGEDHRRCGVGRRPGRGHPGGRAGAAGRPARRARPGAGRAGRQGRAARRRRPA